MEIIVRNHESLMESKSKYSYYVLSKLQNIQIMDIHNYINYGDWKLEGFQKLANDPIASLCLGTNACPPLSLHIWFVLRPLLLPTNEPSLFAS